MESTNTMKIQFNSKISEILQHKRDDNNFFITPEEYKQLIQCIKDTKIKRKKETADYRRLARFDVFAIGKYEKLIKPVNEVNRTMRYYVTTDELFDVIHNTHVLIGHAGRNRMVEELKKKYCNITKETIMVYLTLCKFCLEKKPAVQKVIITKPNLNNYINSRAKINLIDMQSQQYKEYKFIMVYEEYLSKFVMLKPLKSNTAEEVAYHLLDIFTTIGAPIILQSNSGGREFIRSVIKVLHAIWSEVKLVIGKSVQTELSKEENLNHDIENMLHCWMADNNNNDWDTGLKFVQYMKNRTVNDESKRSPYELVFGCKPRLGLSSSTLSAENIETEEDLVNFINQNESVEDVITEGTEEDSSEPHTKKIKLGVLEPAKLGDCVLLPVPEIDRGSSDLTNLTAVVVEVVDGEFYKLATPEGTLRQLYARNEFTISVKELINFEDVKTNLCTLREMVAKISRIGNVSFRGGGRRAKPAL